MGARVESVSPFRCRMWSHHDRLEEYINEQTCRTEIESFSAHGQLVPVLGRPLRANSDADVELIYGARRLFVARHLNKPLLVEIRELTDKEAIVAMDIENRHRTDVSPYERGVAYSMWLRTGLFQSQQEIAKALRVSSSQVSRLLQLAKLPAVVVTAFQTPCDICETWGLELAEVLEDSGKRERVIRKARLLGKVARPAAREVFRQLMTASASQESTRARAAEELVKDVDGTLLFRIRHQRSSICLVLPTRWVSEAVLGQLRSVVAETLRHSGRRVAELTQRSRGMGLAGTSRARPGAGTPDP